MRNSLLLCKQFLFWFLLFGFLSFLDFIFNFDFLIDILTYMFFTCTGVLFPLEASLACIEHPKGDIAFVSVYSILDLQGVGLGVPIS